MKNLSFSYSCGWLKQATLGRKRAVSVRLQICSREQQVPPFALSIFPYLAHEVSHPLWHPFAGVSAEKKRGMSKMTAIPNVAQALEGQDIF